jgi:hypothetical protein
MFFALFIKFAFPRLSFQLLYVITIKYLNHHEITLCCSIEFDRDDELFATTGVSRRIKIFEFSKVSVGRVLYYLTNLSIMHLSCLIPY